MHRPGWKQQLQCKGGNGVTRRISHLVPLPLGCLAALLLRAARRRLQRLLGVCCCCACCARHPADPLGRQLGAARPLQLLACPARVLLVAGGLAACWATALPPPPCCGICMRTLLAVLHCRYDGRLSCNRCPPPAAARGAWLSSIWLLWVCGCSSRSAGLLRALRRCGGGGRAGPSSSLVCSAGRQVGSCQLLCRLGGTAAGEACCRQLAPPLLHYCGSHGWNWPDG